MVAFLVENGANINCKNLEGCTPLHLAASSGHVNIVSYLVDHGAFVNCQDDEGDAPLHYAVREYQSPSLEMIQLLVAKYHASVDITNEDDESPIELARDLGEEDLANSLLQFSSLRILLSPKINTNKSHVVSGPTQLVDMAKMNISSPSSTNSSYSSNCTQSKNERSALSSLHRGSAWVHVQH